MTSITDERLFFPINLFSSYDVRHNSPSLAEATTLSELIWQEKDMSLFPHMHVFDNNTLPQVVDWMKDSIKMY